MSKEFDEIMKEFDEIMDKAFEVFEEQQHQDKLAKEVMCNLGDVVQQPIDEDVFEDETLVRTVTKKLSGFEYFKEEHRNNQYEKPSYKSNAEKLRTHYELLDLALLAKDIKWAKALHKKITELEEKVTIKELEN